MAVVSEASAATQDEQAEVLALLHRAASYPDPTTNVEWVETHISHVFLTDRFVYKLKKPVRFDFLDFSTPEKRRWACEQEVLWNRRLAHDVYLGVVPVCRGPRGRLQLGGTGTPVDWTVKMRRLPAERSLDQLIAADRLTERDVEKLAAEVARFYQQLPPLTLRTEDYRRAFEKHVLTNRDELLDPAHGLEAVRIERIHEGQLRVLSLLPELLEDRVRDGRIVDGHGDLRPEHIYLGSWLNVIDCIEFNEEYRRIDVLDELSFLAMECDVLGAEQVGRAILAGYARASGDEPRGPLVDFYKCYRASVRAKVLALRAVQLGPGQRASLRTDTGRYLAAADRYAASLGKPLLVLVRGLPGTGKSTLAELIAQRLGCAVLQTDVLRRELFGPPAGPVGYNQGRYRPENRERVYAELLGRARRLSHDRRSVVLDGTFPAAGTRVQAMAMARECGAEPLVVHCSCPQHVSLERIRARLARGLPDSETRPEFFAQQRQLDEQDPQSLPRCDVDTSAGAGDAWTQVAARLRQAAFPGPGREVGGYAV